MSPLEQAIATIIGREPTSAEIARFYQVKESAGLSDNDPMWAILIAFGHYEILYGEIPEKISSQTVKLLAEHKLALEATAAASGNLVKQSLADAVSKSAAGMAADVMKHSSRSARRWMLVSLGVAATALLLLASAAFWAGHRVAAADGAWLSTPEGQAAREFSNMNNLRAMLDCPEQFQRTTNSEGTYCVPYDAQIKKSWGWRIK